MCVKAMFSRQELIAIIVLVSACLIAMIFWLVLMSRLIALHPERRNPHKYLIWTIYIPYLNLLWIPWALISAHGIIKKVQQSYGDEKSLGTAMGSQILTVPSLVLYLFWGVIITIITRYACFAANKLEIAMYACVAIICVLLVFACYLIYLSAFVHRITELLKSKGKTS
jgi:hypothetical protein